jgi:hypothetical protein
MIYYFYLDGNHVKYKFYSIYLEWETVDALVLLCNKSPNVMYWWEVCAIKANSKIKQDPKPKIDLSAHNLMYSRWKSKCPKRKQE